MRHLLANILTYAIAALLFIGAAAFAWMRSSQLLLTTEASVLAQYEPAEDTGFHWQVLGRQSYERNCANCHRSDGRGWDQYPPVTSAAALLEHPSGRVFLIDLHLYGLASARWGAPMPRMGHLRDVEIAAVVNHIASEFADRSAGPLLRPEEVSARRGLGLTPRQVNEGRPPTVPSGR